jgi:hypothetical protein
VYRLTLGLVVATVVLSGCGRSDIGGKDGTVVVKRPVLPIYLCRLTFDGHSNAPCRHRFNAGQMISLRLNAANTVVEAHGYSVRRVAPLARGEALTADLGAASQAHPGGYTAIAVIGVVFTLLGLVMIFDVRRLGERVVGFMILLGTALGAEKQTRRIAAHKRLFAVGWGAMALSFGVGALLIAALH